MQSGRVFVLGLDGATFDLLDPWLRSGELAELGRFMQSSSYGRLESTIPPISPPAWTSFMTGVNPGKHGIYDFMAFKPRSFEKILVNSSHIRTKPFWDLAGERGKKSIILNVPMTYPPQKIEGVMISGIPSPPPGAFISPPEMGRELEEKVGTWWVDVEGDRFRDFEEESFLREIDRNLEIRFKVAEYLIRKEWDLFVFVVTETDMVQHLLWGKRDRCLLPVYRKIDEGFGVLLRSLRKEDTVIVLSDHGFGPLKKTFYLNTWLEEKGFLKSRRVWSEEGPNPTPEVFHRHEKPPSILRRLRGRLKKPKRVIDWGKTDAYFFDTGQLQGIAINLKGREPEGIVTPERYEVLRKRIMQELEGILDEEEAKKVIVQVFRREDVYEGPCVENAPDIVFVPNYEYAISSRIRRMTFREGRKGLGCHRLHGIFMIRGEGVRQGDSFEGIRIIDMAPTILYSLNLAIPKDFDGRVPTEIMLPSFQKSHPVRFEEIALEKESARFEMEREEVEAVKMKLRGLGYIE